MVRISFTKAQLELPAALDLLQLLQTATADGRLTEAEIGALSEWLRQHQAEPLPAVTYLADVVQRVLEDGRVTPEEQAWVQKAIETVLPPVDRQEAATRRREAVSAARREAREKWEREREELALVRPIEHFDFMVAGAFYEDRQATIRHVSEGQEVILARQPANPYSPNAILVMLPNDRHIGYMPERNAVEFAPLIDGGARHEAEVKKLLRGERGLIPVVWGDLFSANSQSGRPSPVVQFAEPPPAPRDAGVHPSARAGPNRPHAGKAISGGRCGLIVVAFLATMIAVAVLLRACLLLE
jgi:hypothetical protein